MILLSLQNIHKSFGVRSILKGASLVLQDRERMGLVGVNSSGKSTLLKIIAGLEEPDSGTVSLQKGLKIGYLAQHGEVNEDETVLETLEHVFDPVVAMEAELRQREADMAAAADDPDTLARLGSAYDRQLRAFEDANGYGWRSTVQGVLAGLGFTKAQQDQKAGLLSGGERTRLCLGRLLLQSPDLLLLDEPTNHLDLKAVAWLEGFLSTYRGAVLLISHDRYFMDAVCGRMGELLFGTVECYDGNYSAYLGQRVERFAIRQKAYDMQQREIARQEAIIARFKMYNTEASLKKAHSREKALDRMERLERPNDERAIRFSFKARRRSGEDVLMGEGLTKGFEGRTLFQGLDFHVRLGDRIAILGDNGVGKSTLLKIIAGEWKPDGGLVRFGTGVDVGYYDQHQRKLNPEKTVLDEVWDDFRRMEQTDIRSALGLFLFTGDEVLAPIKTLSGGEKGRVALTKLILRQDNLLLLDEPTNHLDMDSREVLEDALSTFTGTIIAVSHDRYFINQFADKIWVMDDGGIQEYLGNYDDYQEKISRQQPPDSEVAGITKTELEKQKRKSREEKLREKAAREALDQLEKQIEDTEREIARMEAHLATPEAYTTSDSQDTLKQYHQLKETLARLYDEWAAMAE